MPCVYAYSRIQVYIILLKLCCLRMMSLHSIRMYFIVNRISPLMCIIFRFKIKEKKEIILNLLISDLLFSCINRV